jgi:rhamnose utilization protein RhaD (predicted bifunctional aldolase and dehydrogenase)/NAD(P)-dependent dehydrogenase (short-subunit alcohol dehydrogenase family)
MQSRYVAAEAQSAVDRYAPRWGEDLARRVHSSRLMGADPALVLHGGGNTSVKSTAREAHGAEVEVIYVKGSGWDLATIEPAGFSPCRLAPLRALCALPELTDDAMVAALRSQMLDPASPTPSVEALLHAFLPGKFVDHTHADAVLALQDQPDARALAAEVWGDEFRFIPYVMPGFVLAKRVVELAGDLRGVHGLVLEQHGIFTWGETAEESYERMIAAVDRAEQWRASRRPVVPVALPPSDGSSRHRLQTRLSPLLRGAFARVGAGRFVLEWREDEATRAFTARADARTITERGTVTPDHVIRTKPRPMWLPAADQLAAMDDTSLRATCESAAMEFAQWYEEYFGRHAARDGVQNGALTMLDRAPRVVVVPGLGALTLGRSLNDARVTGDVFVRAVQVMQSAEALGRFHPVSERDLFDVEYWSLEQAKLKGSTNTAALAGRIALVTGAASGIGFATAEHFLTLGAHVFLVDREENALREALASLASGRPADAGQPKRAGFSLRVAGGVCDVTDRTAVERVVADAVHAFGGIDILVSNAGSAPQGKLHTSEGAEALEKSLALNLLGHQHCAAVVSRVMLAQGTGGALLFNASKSAFNQGPDFGPYAVPKAALVALMKQYAVDLGAQHIRANAVNADRVRTALFGGGVLETRARARGLSPDEYFTQNLLGRETTAQDVAAAFAYLALAEATTGCVVPVDGGNAAAFPR